VNKYLWSGLGWNPDTDPHDILREYGRFFISTDTGDAFADGLFALEQTGKAPLMSNTAVETTMRQFQELERRATPQNAWELAVSAGPYRANYDAYLRERLTSETEQEHRSLGALDEAQRTGALNAVARAEAILRGDASYSAVRGNGERGLSNWPRHCFRAFACNSAWCDIRRSPSAAAPIWMPSIMA